MPFLGLSLQFHCAHLSPTQPVPPPLPPPPPPTPIHSQLLLLMLNICWNRKWTTMCRLHRNAFALVRVRPLPPPPPPPPPSPPSPPLPFLFLFHSMLNLRSFCIFCLDLFNCFKKGKVNEMQNKFLIGGDPLFLLLPLLNFLSQPPTILPLSYSLNATVLDGLWHRAAVMALLRLQAKSLANELNLPTTERIVFSECEREAQKVVEMAKCVAKLLRKRERIKAEENKEEKRRRKTNWTEKKPQGEKRRTHFGRKKLLRILKVPFGSEGAAANKKPLRKKGSDVPSLNWGKMFDEDEKVNSLGTAQKHWPTQRIGRRRRRREIIGGRFAHVDSLNELQRFWEMRQFCENYLAEMAERNAKFLRAQSPFHVNLRVNNLMDEKISKANVLLMDDISNQLNNFMQKIAKRKKGPLWHRLSIVSPRLFSLPFSSPREKAQSENDQLIDSLLLSPRLFSLSPNDGLFALPDLFSNQRMMGKKHWMNAILELSGAGKAIRTALDGMEDERRRLEEKVFPTVLDLERRDKQWENLLDDEQKRKMEQHGFAFLTKEQAKLIYGNEKVTDSEFIALNSDQRQHRIEKAIIALANLDDQFFDGQPKLKRERRQFENGSELNSRKWENGSEQPREKERTEPKGDTEHLKVLAPYAFANSVADGVALEATILSPSAFVSELISPVALATGVLSPRAFIAAILSPEALLSRVLSPSAFFSEILSPRALTPFILSPEAMFTEILTPRALEPRILSPEIGMIKVLSPEFLSPRVISPEQLAILVLSPAILSPEILSRQKMVVEIISPHILSGGSSETEEQEHEKHQQHHKKEDGEVDELKGGEDHEGGRHGIAGKDHQQHGIAGEDHQQHGIAGEDHYHRNADKTLRQI